MRVLGIDPGISCTGYAVLDQNDDGIVSLVELGVIRTVPADPLPKRLKTIYEGVEEVINSLEPGHLAVETVFVGRNVQSALKLGQARGTAIVAAARSGLDVLEFSPREVKQNITGNGNASKEQVQFMVTSILKLTKVPKPNDAADAVAIALSFIQTYKFKTKIKILSDK